MERQQDCGQYAEKVKVIIEAAQKRFGLYGLEKTTMREIASDLNMSKGSLYYYFPDKEHLYRAVFEKEQCLFLNTIKEKMRVVDDPQELLQEYVQTRLYYFKSLLNLGNIRRETFRGIKSVMQDVWLRFREKERELLVAIFRKGLDRGVFREFDAEKTAGLFLDLLKGLRETSLGNKERLYIDEGEYQNLLENTLLFTEIFTAGISKTA